MRATRMEYRPFFSLSLYPPPPSLSLFLSPTFSHILIVKKTLLIVNKLRDFSLSLSLSLSLGSVNRQGVVLTDLQSLCDCQ